MAWIKIGKNKAAKELKKIIGEEDVPQFPQVVTKVLELLRNPEADFGEIAEHLMWDPAMTLKVLQLANSSAYGASRPIQDVQHAIGFLGRSVLEQIVLGVAVRGALPRGDAPGFESRRFWVTSAYRASLAKSLARELHPSGEAISFTAALLQDLAIPVLAHALPERYGKVLAHWHGDANAQLHALERKASGLES